MELVCAQSVDRRHLHPHISQQISVWNSCHCSPLLHQRLQRADTGCPLQSANQDGDCSRSAVLSQLALDSTVFCTPALVPCGSLSASSARVKIYEESYLPMNIPSNVPSLCKTSAVTSLHHTGYTLHLSMQSTGICRIVPLAGRM